MALIQCPECSRDISDRAKACPQCGYPLNEPLPEPAKPKVQEEFQTVNAQSGVMDGLRLGVGMFILLPFMIAGVVFLIYAILIAIGSAKYPIN